MKKDKKKQKKDKFVVIGTKTSPEFAQIFDDICKAKGLNKYKVVQMMVDTFVRYTDDRHNLSAEMEHLMTIFEHMEGWDKAFNLADPTPTRSIEEAVYLLTGKRRNGSRAVMVRRPFFGDWEETSNIQVILERMIEVLCPERYLRLRALAVEMECSSILELLDVMIDAHTIEALNAQYRKDFEDNARHDYGKPVEYGQRTVRHHHKSIEDMEQEDARAAGTTIRFKPEDVPTGCDGIEPLDFLENLEWEPHGDVW